MMQIDFMCLFKKLKKLCQNVFNDRKGSTAIEYGLIAAGIALVIIAGVQAIGTNSSTTYDNVAVALSGPNSDFETSSCTPENPCGGPETGGGAMPPEPGDEDF